MTTQTNPNLYVAFAVLAGQGDDLRAQLLQRAPFFQQIGYADYVEGTKGFMDAKLNTHRYTPALEAMAFMCPPKEGRPFGDAVLDIAGILARDNPSVFVHVTATEHLRRSFSRGHGPAYKKVSLG